MNQRTHTWLAIRAVGLLEELGEIPDFVKLVSPFIKSSAIGAWIPDLQDSKIGGGDIDYHILKMKPYNGSQPNRFILRKDDLLAKLGSGRLMSQFLKEDNTLSNSWWGKPYKAEPQPGQHLANRSMALATSVVDLLILGDKKVAKLVPGTISFANNLAEESRTSEEQVTTFLFMLSHFIADSCMPCHCDARDLADYSKGLHKELESHWSKKIGTYFDKRKLFENQDSSNKILAEAKIIDSKFKINFPNKIPSVKSKDVWEEIVYVCRGSFALANIIAPDVDYPYNSSKKAPFNQVFSGSSGEELLSVLDKVIMHDAILNIAIIWKYIWNKFE